MRIKINLLGAWRAWRRSRIERTYRRRAQAAGNRQVRRAMEREARKAAGKCP